MTALMIYGAGALIAAFLLYLILNGEEIAVSDLPMMLFGVVASWLGVVLIIFAAVSTYVEYHGENKVLFTMPKLGRKK